MQEESTNPRKASGAKAAIALGIAGYALFGDNVVGIIVILAAAAAVVHPLVLWALSAAIVALINVGCCYWVVGERAAFSDGAGGRLEKRLEGMRNGRVMRRPIGWISDGGAGRFALAAILTNAIMAVAAASMLGVRVDGRRILYASVAFAAVSCGLHTTFGSLLGYAIRSLT